MYVLARASCISLATWLTAWRFVQGMPSSPRVAAKVIQKLQADNRHLQELVAERDSPAARTVAPGPGSHRQGGSGDESEFRAAKTHLHVAAADAAVSQVRC